MVRIGINPLTWTNDDLPALGDSNSLETCLSEAKLAELGQIVVGPGEGIDADAYHRVSS